MRMSFLITVIIVVTVAFISCDTDKGKEHRPQRPPLLFIYKGEQHIDNYEKCDMVTGTGVYEGNAGGLVSSPYMAACIANVIMTRIYGREDMQNRYPLHVTLINDEYWYVKGGKIYTDRDKKGPPVIVLNRSDGQVVSSTSRSY